MQRSLASTPVLSLALASLAAAQLQTARVSVDSAGMQGNGDSFGPALSADARIAVFSSTASNLVAGDTNGLPDVFARDLQTGTTTCLSVSWNGAIGNGECLLPSASVSSTGRYVVFLSDATNLVLNDNNAARDVFVRDRTIGLTTRISVATGVQANGDSHFAGISTSGRYVVFSSDASNLAAGDTNGRDDVFVRDLQQSTTTLVSVGLASAPSDGDSVGGTISSNGHYICFYSYATNLVAGDNNAKADVFVRDQPAGVTARISVDSSGFEGNDTSIGVEMTPDGRYALFHSYASNLVANDNNGKPDVFVHDLATGQTTRESVDSAGIEGDGESFARHISPDGRYVGFTSVSTNLVAGDTNAATDVFVRDRFIGKTIRVSLDGAGIQANGECSGGFISSDAKWVGFSTAASNIVAGDTNGKWDVFLREFDPPCGALSYCTSGTTTSGCAASMSATGTPSASATSGFTVIAGNLEGQRNGMIFYGISGALALPWSSTSTSVMCVKPPTQRTFTQSSGGSLGQCNGQISLDWNAFKVSFPGALGAPFSAGDVVRAQCWFRDPPAPKTSNLSDGLEFIVCP